MSYYMPTGTKSAPRYVAVLTIWAVFITYVGLSSEKARLLSACNATSYLVASCLAIPLVERVGRRGLMLLSTAGQGLSFLVITILLSIGSQMASKAR